MKPGRYVSAVGAAAALALTGVAPAQTYPSKSVQLIVPFAPASAADVAARFAAQGLARALSQPIIVVNKPGAGGTIGTAELAQAAPDGYTIGFVSQATLAFNLGVYPNPGYDSLKDFAPIAWLGRATNVMVVHPTNPASTPGDVVSAARSAPGKLTFASAGSGSSQHLTGVLFGRATGADLVHVPYKGAAQGVLAVMSNEVTMGFFNVSLVIAPIKDGKLKALGVTSLRRSPVLPAVPTLDEQGIKDFEIVTWAGFVAPAGTPPAIVARLNEELIRIFSGQEARERLASQGIELAAPLTPAEFAKLIADDVAHWVPIVKASGARAD